MKTALAYIVRIVGLTIATLFVLVASIFGLIVWVVIDAHGLWVLLLVLGKAAACFAGAVAVFFLLVLPFAWASEYLEERRKAKR